MVKQSKFIKMTLLLVIFFLLTGEVNFPQTVLSSPQSKPSLMKAQLLEKQFKNLRRRLHNAPQQETIKVQVL